MPDFNLDELKDTIASASLQLEASRIGNAVIVATFAARLAYSAATKPLGESGPAPLPEHAALHLLEGAFELAFHEYLHGDDCTEDGE
jgi:hypothetical protein